MKLVILGFWKFSRNRLAGLQSRQVTHIVSHIFWVPEEESPGGITLVARRHEPATQFFWVLLNFLAVMNTRQATQTHFGSILMF